MIKKLIEFLTVPDFKEDDKTYTARMLYILLVGIFILSGGFAIPFTVIAPEIRGRYLILAAIVMPSSIGLLMLTRRGHTRLASWLLVGMLWTVVTVGAITSGGVRAPIFTGFVVIIFTAGFLIGPRAGIVATIVSVLSGMAIIYAEYKNMLSSTINYSPLIILSTNAFFFLVVMILQQISSHTTSEALRRAHEELDERRITEKELRESRSNLAEAQHIAHVGNWYWDIKSNQFHWSDELYHIFGILPGAELDYFRFLDAIHPEDRDWVKTILDTSIREKKPFHIEHRLIRADGAVRYVQRNAGVILDEKGEPVRMIGIVQDVTDRRLAEEKILNLNLDLEDRVRQRTEQLEAANRELESFAYSVSHDLRAPLRSITGFSQILLAEYSNSLGMDGKQKLQNVIDSAREMNQRIESLLTLSRLDLSGMARSILEELLQSEPDRQVECIIANDMTAIADPRMIRPALENLLGNAWKYTGKVPQACIEFGIAHGAGETVYFISDNGAGFDMKYVGKLFGAFQRLHAVEEFPGHGIGLATVQRIIHRHGGRVWAEGEVGKGATFYFTLP
jgi:PAS domain S-box-containing protein